MPQTPPLLELHVHDSARVVTADGQTLALRGRAAALVALVALEPGVSRERAALLLWPDSPKPRQTLRQQLLRFRQALGVPLLDGDPLLSLAPGVQLQRALPGHRLLADENTSDDAWGQWLQQRRTEHEAAQRQHLQQALAAAEAAGDLDEALQLARTLLALDGQDEAHHALLMRVHFLRGESAAGLVAFQQLGQMLHSQFGAKPSPSTEALAKALRQGGATAPGGLPTTAAMAATATFAANAQLPLTLKRPPVMAGRRTELAAVAAGWAEGLAVLIEGEAGMGKSRLLSEYLAGVDGVLLHAAARPGDSGSPYSALARLLKHLLPKARDAALSATAQQALVCIGAAGAAPAGAATAALPAGALQSAVAELLAQAGVQTVVLDDLHFADAATLELVSGLVAAEGTCRWLFAQRAAEAPPAATALRHALTELRRLSVVVLAPLDPHAAAELVDALAVPGLQGEGLAAQLVQHSGGNPLFMLETLKQGLQDGSLARGQLPRPSSVGALLEQRLQRLSAPALTLVRVAAIAGVDFCIELAEAAIGHSAVQLASAWRELQDAQVLRDEALAHDLVADAALQGVPPVVARRVHAQCAAWLAQHGGEPARVARHWLAGGQPEPAAKAFEAAASRARVAARQGEEAELYAQAASAYAAAGQPEARFEALSSHVAALIGANADESALRQARALPDQASNDHQRTRALRVLCDLIGQRGPFEEAVQVARSGMALAQRIGDQVELVRLACVAAANLCKSGRPQEAYSLMLPLRTWVDAEADSALRPLWHGSWAGVLGHIGRLREAVVSYDIAVTEAERAGEWPLVERALQNQGITLRTMGAAERAYAVSARALKLCSDEPGNFNRQLSRLVLARNEAETGRFAAATEAFDELMPAFKATGAPFWLFAAGGAQARVWQHLGQLTRALQALQGDDAEMPGWMRAGRLWVRLEVQHWLGKAAPEAEVQQAVAYLEKDPFRHAGNAARGLRFMRPQQVLEAAPALAEQAQALELFGTVLAIQMHRARALCALGQHEPARAAALLVVDLLQQGYAPDYGYLPEAWLVASRSLQAAGDAVAARTALGQAEQWVRQRALPQVPAPFVDSFLHRNPVNRELLAGADSATGG